MTPSPPPQRSTQTATAASGALQTTAIPAFRDNYIWLLARDGRALIIDPGEADPVQQELDRRGLRLETILVTHHHGDHVGGVAALAAAHGATVFGPAGSPFTGIDRPLRDGDRVHALDLAFTVLAVPGHTLDHIAYWCAAASAVFCGDTLFAGGCGRLFEGSAAQMYASLSRLAALPEETQAYCAHEYTQANLRFALAVEPSNSALQQRYADCAQRRAQGVATVPSAIGLERATNPFLRCAEPAVRAAAHAHDGAAATDPATVFAVLRTWKDGFS